ncbi:type IV pilin protein [Amphritea sp.]|uniref:type IV pilin protein n=1 Tax=Amphritea sp. TaxID=1872502 RepID=UPI0025C6A99D|nr:type IV pilin protein [Amphritea sp.]
MTQMKHERGFTLLELLIVVAIVGILSAIAYPSYQESVADGRRVDAQANLLSLAQYMEREYTENGAYDDAGTALPYNEAPKDGTPKFYDLALTVQSGAVFTIRARPKNGMLGDRCGDMTLTHTGQKNAVDPDCW